MNQEILQTGGLMFYGRDLAQRWIFVRVGGVRRVVVREVSSLRCRMAMTLGLCAIAVSLAGCGAGGKLPDKSSKEYAETVSAFYTGLAALQVGDDVTAESKLAQVTQLAPGEPAGWANWGVLAFRQRNFDVAAQRYDRARELAPKNDQIYYLLGILQSTRGNSKDAIADWRKAVGINPQNYRAAYQLALEVEREGGPGSDAEFESLIQNILKAQPDNLAAWLELARAAAKRGDSATLKSALAQINARASQWPPEVQQQVAALQVAVAGGDMHAAAMRTTFLRNTLMRVAEFRESLGVLQAAAGRRGRAFHPFSAIGTAGVRSGAGGPGADVYAAGCRKSGREAGGETLGMDWLCLTGKCWPSSGRGSERPRGASFNRRDISLPRWSCGSGASRLKASCRLISTMISRTTWCWRVRAASG